MGPLFALTALLSVLFEPTNAECTFAFVRHLIPLYNRKMQDVPHDLGKLHSLLSNECPPHFGGFCFNYAEFSEFSEYMQDGNPADLFAQPPYLDDPKAWGNYMEALVLWFLACCGVASFTVLCLWPGCCCFCCCAHKCTRSRTKERLQTFFLVAFMVLVVVLILVSYLAYSGLSWAPYVTTEKPVRSLNKLIRALPDTAGRSVVRTVSRTGVKTLQQGNATFHEYFNPEQLNHSLHCAQDGLEIVDQVMSSLTGISDAVKEAVASLSPKDDQELCGSLTAAVAAVQTNASGARTVLEELSVARPVVEKDLDAVATAGHQTVSLTKELQSTLGKAKSNAGRLYELKDECTSFHPESASQEDKEAHVRRLKVHLKKIPDAEGMAETISSLNRLIDSTRKSLESFMQKWKALKDTLSGASGSLKDLPSTEAMAASFESIERGLAVLGSLHTTAVKKAISKLQEANVTTFAEQAQRLKYNIICALEAKKFLTGAVLLLGNQSVGMSLSKVEAQLGELQQRLNASLPDFDELSDKLKEVSAHSTLTPDVEHFLDQINVLEQEVAKARAALDSAPWKEAVAFGRWHDTLDASAFGTKVKELSDMQEVLSNPELDVKVEVTDGVDLAAINKEIEMMLEQRNFDRLPELHRMIKTQLPDVAGFRQAATNAIGHLEKVPNVDAEAEKLRQAIPSIPDSKDAIRGLKTLEDAISKMPDPSTYTEGVNRLLSGVSYLQKHTDDFAKTITDTGTAVKDLPHTKLSAITATVERIIHFTGSDSSVEGSLAWWMDQWSAKSLERTQREEGLSKVLKKVFDATEKSLRFLGFEQEMGWSFKNWPPSVTRLIDAFEDRPMRGGSRPSENGALWYTLYVLANLGGEANVRLLRPKERFAALGDRALVMGYLRNRKLRPYSAHVLCLTQDCLENTIGLVRKGNLQSLSSEPVPTPTVSPESLVYPAFIGPLLLCLLAGLVLATRVKCFPCCFLCVALLLLPGIMISLAVSVPTVIFGADLCGSTGSLSISVVSKVAEPICGFEAPDPMLAWDNKNRACVWSYPHIPVKALIKPEEVVRSIVDRCNGRAKPNAEAVQDFWRQSAGAFSAWYKVGFDDLPKAELGAPLVTLIDNFGGNMSLEVEHTILEIGKTVDCGALNDIYSDAKDTLCCHMGGNLYLFVMSFYALCLCILYCGLPGAAIGMMGKVEESRRPSHFIGPDGRTYAADDRDMVEMRSFHG